MSETYFITSTDTECGKTYVTCQLLDYFKRQGKSVLGLKPIAAGTDNNGCNEDALLLQGHSSVELDYQQTNPFCFEAPVSPNIAASWQQASLTAAEVDEALKPLKDSADTVLIEGAGGICVPFNDQENWLDLLDRLQIPVILVVGMKLGCINHALLSEAMLLSRGVEVVGWVANQIAPGMLAYQENLATLKTWLKTPMLAEVKHNSHLGVFTV